MTSPTDPTKKLYVPLPPCLTVTVAQDTVDDAQGLYGTVKSTGFGSGGAAIESGSTNLIATLAGAMGGSAALSQAGISSTTPGFAWGVALGANASASTGLPANPAVPYIFMTANGGGASLSFGQITASVGSSKGFSALVDPADPSFELDINGLPIVNDAAIGLSVNELIPYIPTSLSSDAQPLYGDLFLRGSLDVAALTDDMAPINLSGDITLALDYDHLGIQNIANFLTLSGDVKTMTGQQALQQTSSILQDLRHISIGANAQVSLSLSLGSMANISMPAATGSLEWMGASDMLYFGGKTANPLTGTPLASYIANDQANLTGTVNCDNGAFDIQGGVSIGYTGVAFAGASFEVQRDSTGYVKAALDADYDLNVNVSLLGASAAVDASGIFDASYDSRGNLTVDTTSTFTATASFMGKSATYTSNGPTIHISGNTRTGKISQFSTVSSSAQAQGGLAIGQILTGN